MNKEIITILNKCRIPFNDEQQLEGMVIPRDTMLSDKIYDEVQEDLKTIKQFYSSSGMKCLQQNAPQKEKWPLLNLVRQLLKASNYNMRPIRVCDGYTKNKKKKYKRLFRIESFKKTDEAKIPSIPIVDDNE